MSTAAGGVRSPEPPSAPWLMLPPRIDGGGSLAYKFHRLAGNDDFSCENKVGGDGDGDELHLPLDIDIAKDVDFAGSSHGWLALFNRRNYDLHLSNPITDRHIKLPPPPLSPPPPAFRVILSSSPEEEGCLAFAIVGGGRAALCSPGRSKEWTFLSGGGGGGDCAYEDLVYSSAHKRLFCVTDGSAILESWEMSDECEGPRLDWAIQDKRELDFSDGMKIWFDWPRRCMLKQRCAQVKYLVCDGSSDTTALYLVVRHVNPRAGPYVGHLVDKILISEYGGRQYARTPYKTFDFDVYRIDWEGGKVTHMENSLEGLAIFVGTNHSFAIPAAAGVAGVRPDSVYFTDEIRLAGPTRFARTTYGGHDNGIFDYKNKDLFSCCPFYPIDFNSIRKVLPLPLWFTPPNK